MNETELAWCAGFYDGEGCTGFITTDSGSRQARMSISQKDRRSLYRFQTAMGGIGRVQDHCDRDISHWICTKQVEVWTVLGAMWPYLGEVKREQALRVLTDCIIAKQGEWERRSSGRRAYFANNAEHQKRRLSRYEQVLALRASGMSREDVGAVLGICAGRVSALAREARLHFGAGVGP